MEAVKKELARSRAEGRAAVSALEEEVVRVQMRHEGVQRELVAAKADAEARESELGARTSELASLRASRAAEMAATDAALTELREALAAKEEEVRVCVHACVCACVCACACALCTRACACACTSSGPFCMRHSRPTPTLRETHLLRHGTLTFLVSSEYSNKHHHHLHSDHARVCIHACSARILNMPGGSTAARGRADLRGGQGAGGGACGGARGPGKGVGSCGSSGCDRFSSSVDVGVSVQWGTLAGKRRA